MTTSVVLDTNVFVSAGFNAHSHSAEIIDGVRNGRYRMIWNEATRAETRHILQKIPPLDWEAFADLFRKEDRLNTLTHPERYSYVSDEADRKFLALAASADAVLISHDDHLLEHADRADVPILTPRDFLDEVGK